MAIGTQFIAREGLLGLEKGRVYYLLSNQIATPFVQFALFTGQGAGARVHVLKLSRDDFEKGLQTADIEPASVQHQLPPWFWDIENLLLRGGQNPDWRLKESHRAIVQNRLEALGCLLKHESDILQANSPVRAISAILHSVQAHVNHQRTAMYFLAYVLHGRDSRALLPQYHRCGIWDRAEDAHAGTKFGRPAKRRGRKHGFSAAGQLAEQICTAFLAFAQECRTWRQIYVKALERNFRCESVKDENTGQRILIQPEGKPFPTYDQFQYWVRKRYSRETISTLKYGEHYVHLKLKADEGSYAEATSSLMQQVEFDGYYVKEIPRSIDGKWDMPPLCIIRAVCVRSKVIVGIGISGWKERAAAYDACLFSMAIPKQDFCALFGIQIAEDEWPGSGYPRALIIDRGAGMALVNRLDLAVVNVTPTGKGQAKASVETHHPKRLRVIEGHEFIESDLDCFQLIRQEINRVLIHNHTCNVLHLFTPKMLVEGSGSSPLDIWRHLQKVYHNDSYPVAFDTAVRDNLVEEKIKIRQDGIYLHHLRYSSPVLKRIGLFDSIARAQSIPGVGYILHGCLKRIWIDYQGCCIAPKTDPFQGLICIEN